MNRPKKKAPASPRPRGYGAKTIDEKRREALRNAGLALPDLTAYQFGQVYGLDQLAKDTRIEPYTLRRTLLGKHGKEPIEELAAIAKAPRWKNVEDAPVGLAAWRLLWAAAHEIANADPPVTENALDQAVAKAMKFSQDPFLTWCRVLGVRHEGATPHFSSDPYWDPVLRAWLRDNGDHDLPRELAGRALCERFVEKLLG